MRLLMLCGLLPVLTGCVERTIDLGEATHKDPPTAKEMKAPAGDARVDTVGLYATVKGTLAGGEKRNVYVLVNPLSNPATRNVWWVQRRVHRSGDTFQASAQFGESDRGAGESFAILVVVTNASYEVGEQLRGVPSGASYTRLKIVKRPR